jgi:hypothetical protein
MTRDDWSAALLALTVILASLGLTVYIQMEKALEKQNKHIEEQ